MSREMTAKEMRLSRFIVVLPWTPGLTEGVFHTANFDLYRVHVMQ